MTFYMYQQLTLHDGNLTSITWFTKLTLLPFLFKHLQIQEQWTAGEYLLHRVTVIVFGCNFKCSPGLFHAVHNGNR